MKAAALIASALAAALLIAALAQAASLRKRLATVPAPQAGAASSQTEPPPSPYEMAELAKRVEACVARLDAKMDRENKALKEARDRFSGIKTRTDEALASMGKESADIKEQLGSKAADKAKVAEMTKRIRTEQQKKMIRQFMGRQLKDENEKLKGELGLTPEQAAQFDKVSDEMFDKFAEMGSSFMDGEANPQKFTELVTESNSKMQAFLTEDQFKKYTDYQRQRWGGRGGGNNNGSGDNGSGGGQ